MNKKLTTLFALFLLGTSTIASPVTAKAAMPTSGDIVLTNNDDGNSYNKEKKKKSSTDNKKDSNKISFPKKFSSKKAKYKHKKSSSRGSRY